MGEPALRRSCRGWRELARILAPLALTAAISFAAVGPAAAQSDPDSVRASRQMFEAVLRNDLDAVKRSLTVGADLHARNTRGVTAAEVAVELGHIDIANYLLGAGNGGRGAARTTTAPPPPPLPPSAAAAEAVTRRTAEREARSSPNGPKATPALREKMAAAAQKEKPAPPAAVETPAPTPEPVPPPPSVSTAPATSTVAEAPPAKSPPATTVPTTAPETDPFARYFAPLTRESVPVPPAAMPQRMAALATAPLDPPAPIAPTDVLPQGVPPAPRMSPLTGAPRSADAPTIPTALPIVGAVRDPADPLPTPTVQAPSPTDSASITDPASSAAPSAAPDQPNPASDFLRALGSRLGLGSDDAPAPTTQAQPVAPHSIATPDATVAGPPSEEPTGGPASRFLRRIENVASLGDRAAEPPPPEAPAASAEKDTIVEQPQQHPATPAEIAPPPPPLPPPRVAVEAPVRPEAAADPTALAPKSDREAGGVGRFFRDLGSRLGLDGDEASPAAPTPPTTTADQPTPAQTPDATVAPPAPPAAEQAIRAPAPTALPAAEEPTPISPPPETTAAAPPLQPRAGALAEPAPSPALPSPLPRPLPEPEAPAALPPPLPPPQVAGRRPDSGPAGSGTGGFFRDLGNRLGLGGNEVPAPSATADPAPPPAVAADRPPPPAPSAAPEPPPPPESGGPASRFLSRMSGLVGIGRERGPDPAAPLPPQPPATRPSQPAAVPALPAPVASLPAPRPSEPSQSPAIATQASQQLPRQDATTWAPREVVPPLLPPQRLAALIPREADQSIDQPPLPAPEVAAPPVPPEPPSAAPVQPAPPSSPAPTPAIVTPTEADAPPLPPPAPTVAEPASPKPTSPAPAAQVPAASDATPQAEESGGLLKRLARRFGGRDADTPRPAPAPAAPSGAPIADEQEGPRNVFQWLAEMMSGRDVRRPRRLPPPDLIEQAAKDEAAKAAAAQPRSPTDPWSAKIDRGPEAPPPASAESPPGAPVEQAMAPTGTASDAALAPTAPAEQTPMTLFGLPGAAPAGPSRPAASGSAAPPGTPGGLFGLSALAPPPTEGGSAGTAAPAPPPAEGGGLFGLPAAGTPATTGAKPAASGTSDEPSGGLWDTKLESPDKRPQVAAPPKEPPLPEMVPTGRGFMLGRSLALGKEPPARTDVASGTKVCVEKATGAIVFCLEPPNWPKAAEPAFRVDTILYTGLMAIVRYDGGIATRMQTLFPSDQFDKVVTYFAGLYGRPSEYWTRSIAPLAQARTENPTRIWHARNPANGQVTTLEIRKFDDTRGGFPDTRRGVAMVYVQNAKAIFPQVSTLELMRLKRQR